MALWDKLRGELIDIIEWTEPNDSQILCYRFPRYNNEIKYGAQLTVREGQAAAFVNEGQLADVFLPGRYRLETANMPILTTLKGWKYGFQSPFKCEVYFVSTKQWTDQKWGTQNPIMLRDQEFGPVRVRAFGTYAMKITDPATFLRQLVATDPSFETYEISNQLRNIIVSRFVDAVGRAKIPVLDLAGNYEKLGDLLQQRMSVDLASMGIAITQFYIENVSLPPEVEAALDTRTKMGVLGNLDQYTKFQTAEAIKDAANNPGGIAGAGVGIGAGVAIGQQMAGAMGQMHTASATVAPPAAPAPSVVGSPPPLPVANIYLGLDGVQSGPFDLQAVIAKIRSGVVKRDTLVWKAGMENWAAAETMSDLQGLFG
jgi:membrane protease subunit (stomatin/prohibitin family)